MDNNKNASIIQAIIAFCLPVLLYLKTISYGYTGLDDVPLIKNNIDFLNNFKNVHQVFLTDVSFKKLSYFYRPLQMFSYMVDAHLSGENSIWMYHLSNTLLLGMISCLLFLVLKRLLIPDKVALYSTLIYCSHPLFVPFVAWIPARGDLLLTLFSLLSLLFFAEILRKKNPLYLFLHWATFAIALFCKETAMLLPFLFIIFYFTFNSKKPFEKRYLFIILIYFVTELFWFRMRNNAIAGISGSNHGSFGFIPLISNLRAIPESFARFFLLISIGPLPFFSLLKTLTGLIILVLAVVMFIKQWNIRKKEKIFCLAWFLIFMLPPMLYKSSTIDYLDHRFFLPFIGVLILLLYVVPKKWIEKPGIKISLFYVAFYLFLCSFTFIKTNSYYDQMSFCNSAISQNPNSSLAYNHRGLEKLSRNDFKGAYEDYNKAIEIFPDNTNALINRGTLKERMGDDPGAMEDYNRVINIDPGDDQAHFDRGILHEKLGDNNGAIEDFNAAIAIYPGNDKAYYNLGILKANSHDYRGAIEDYDKATEINPMYYLAYYNKGVLKANMQDYYGAIIEFDKTIDIYPGYYQAYFSIGGAKINLGDFPGAIDYCNKAISLNPVSDQAYYNIGVAKAKMSDNAGALASYNKAIAINPGNDQAYYNRGVLKINTGDYPGALEDFNKAIAIRPDYTEAYNNKGAIMYMTGNFTEAVSNYSKAIEINPKYLSAYENRALAEYHLHDLKGVLENCEKTLRIFPGDQIVLDLRDKVRHQLKK